MTQNSAGFVPVYDFGAPRVLSGRAREAISGGQFVSTSGVAGVISSGINSFDPSTDMLFDLSASGLKFVGVAMHNAGSNEPISVAIGGVVIAGCHGAVTAGQTVLGIGTDTVATGATAGHVIGRALATAASGGYTLFNING